MNSSKTLSLAVGVGALAGLRTFTPPAIVVRSIRRTLFPLRGFPLYFVRSSAVRDTIAALAVGELVADKLPSMPSRLETGALIARAASGAFCGGLIATERRSPQKTIATVALLGGAAAIAGAFIGYHARREFGMKLRVPDAVVGLVEDAIAIGGAFAIVRAARR